MLYFNCINSINKLNHKNIYFCFRNLSFTSSKKADFATKYVPSAVENGKYEKWKQITPKINSTKQFKTILPPPNITGTLHLGHALTVTIQDVLLRWNKQCGAETLWIPGIDHAGIATQVVVEKKLWKEQKKTRHDIGREQFEKEIWLWKEEKAKIIREQIKKLGAVPDWSREMFTMDTKQSKAVTAAFIKLFESGLIYRSDHLINWSCVLRSAISDIEVEYIELSGRTELNVPGYETPIEFGVITEFIYKLYDIDGEIKVCTTRPETIIGDVALAVHPEDNRYKYLHGKNAIHPFTNELIPIICDDFVDPLFGSGVVKVTPAHDPVDFEVGKRHKLQIKQIIDETGVINSDCDLVCGLKRFDARKVVLNKLKEKGLLCSVKDHPMSIPVCSRSKDIIEYLIKPQWFLNCNKMAEKAVTAVKKDRLSIEPQVFEKVWFNWLENIKDWCISRQLWWGHRIPAFECTYKSKKIWIAAENENFARKKAATQLNTKPDNIMVVQDNDVLDTWFSSGILPFSVFGWPENNLDLQNYPLTLLETGHDILFFWVARMVMLGTELTGKLPFNKILLHGIICDAHGRKMSKSLGNVVNPENIISGITLENLTLQIQNAYNSGVISKNELDRAVLGQKKMFPAGIPECGTDALRFTLCSHNTKAHFINFDINECHTNKLFCNKIWQACKYTRLCVEKIPKNSTTVFSPNIIDKWILSRLSYMISEINSAFLKYDLHVATSCLKQFLYNEFCDVYVECTKPAFRNPESTVAANHVATLTICLDRSLRCLSPFMPFLTEELYSHLPKHEMIESYSNIFDAPYPTSFDKRNEPLENDIQIILNAVSVIRRLQKLSNISNKAKTHLISSTSVISDNLNIIKTLTNCRDLIVSSDIDLSTKTTVSDTIGSYGVVYIEVPKVDRDFSNEEVRLLKKIDKLLEKIGKMQKMSSDDSYKINAPIKVQEAHLKQLTLLENELDKLQQLHKSLIS